MHCAAKFYSRLGFGTLAAWIAGPALAANLDIKVLDEHGEPVPDVVIYAERLDARPGEHLAHPASSQPAVMDQIGSEFVPHILVVASGTDVVFPNNDTVSHHVYSFSPTKQFELDLYRGNIHPPQLFDRPGLVVLGCNIHDSMLGFILVVDTPYFGKTGGDGALSLSELPAGSYRVRAWTPRTSDRNQPPPQELMVGDLDQRAFSFHFTSKLQPPHSTDPGSLEWKHY